MHGDVAVHECVPRVGRNSLQVAQVAGISQLVEVDQPRAFPLHPSEDEIGPNETRSSGHQDRIFHDGQDASGGAQTGLLPRGFYAVPAAGAQPA